MTKFTRGIRVGLFLVVAAVSGVVAHAAGKEAPWLRLATPEFVVLTTLKEKEATAWTAEFSQYIAALRGFFTQPDRSLMPLTIVVFARERDFERYRPLGADGKPQQVAGFFLQHGSWAVAGLAGASVPQDVRRTIFHEGVHWFLSGTENPNPVWIEEGLAEVFSTFEIVKRQAEWGRAIPEHVLRLRQQGLLPLERLVATGREELFGKDENHTGTVYAQSWAFAHFLVFGQHTLPRNALSDYAKLSGTAVGFDDAFQRAFGKTYKEMDALLDRYIRDGSYFINRRPLAEFAAPSVAAATRAEAEGALGRLALGARRWEVAAGHARAVVAADAGDPRGDEILGLALKEAGDAQGALAAFTLAAEHGSKDAQTYFELAQAEHNAAAGTMGEITTMAPEAARRVANLYEKAINLNPRFKIAYQNLAGVLDLAAPWSEQDRRFLEFGRKLWPRDEMIQVGLAVVTRRAGDKAEARARLEQAVASPSGDGGPARAYARRLAEAWEQQDLVQELNALVEAKKFSAALAFIAEHLERGVSATTRAQLSGMQRSLEAALKDERIATAFREQRWVEARRLLTEMLGSDASFPLKNQAKRSLAELDRLRLGLEEAAK